MRQVAGYDFIIQAMGGLMSITGEKDDLPGGGPQKVGVAVADITTGMYSTVAILAAIVHRSLTGQGQYIDMALLDSQVAMIANMNMNYLVGGKAPKRMGNAHANIVPYQVFDASDGQFVVAVGNDGQFAKFCEAAGQAFHQDPRFLRNDDRVRNRDVLIPLLTAVLKQRTVSEWIALFEPLGIPVGGINNLAQVFDHAQVRSRGMRIDLPHPQAGTVPMVANPIKMSETPLSYQSAPPLLGQHTREVLADAGLTAAEIEQLQSVRHHLKSSKKTPRSQWGETRGDKGCFTDTPRCDIPLRPDESPETCGRNGRHRTATSRARCAWRRGRAAGGRSSAPRRRGWRVRWHRGLH